MFSRKYGFFVLLALSIYDAIAGAQITSAIFFTGAFLIGVEQIGE
jgi:hypothetical protein